MKLTAVLALSLVLSMPGTPPRLRDLGLSPGVFPPGPLNAITDVAGVKVGHRTLIEGDSVRTGVTAVVPHGGNVFQKKAPAAVFVGNGFGHRLLHGQPRAARPAPRAGAARRGGAAP